MASKESSTSTIGPIEINETLKSTFKATCAERKTSMTKEIVAFIEGFVKRYRKVPVVDPVPEESECPGES